MTPDEDFILDTHPTWKNIIIAAGFSGGFVFFMIKSLNLSKQKSLNEQRK